MKKEIFIAFVGFWNSFDINDNFLINPLKKKFKISVIDVEKHPELKNKVQYLFYGDFSKSYLTYSCVRIYYTGENLFPNFNSCDYAIGYDYISLDDRYIRYPLYLSCYNNDLALALKKHIKIADELANRKFCSMVVSNNWHCSEDRELFFKKLSCYKKVDSGGRYLNNINMPKGVPDKNKFQEQYKFSICFENSSSPGYCTEKLLQGFAAKTIPIYWGDPTVSKQFNKKAFINCHDFSSFDDVINYIKVIDKDDTLYLKILSQPAINIEYVNNQRDSLEKWLLHIFNQDYKSAFKRKKYGYNLQIEQHALDLESDRNKYEDLVSDNKKLFTLFLKKGIIISLLKIIKRKFLSYKESKLTRKREKYLLSNKRKLKNTSFSIIASNYLGGNICHDLGIRFNSPFINLWISAKDYIKLLTSLKSYLSYPLEFITDKNFDYPVAYLNDIKLYFQHYDNCEIAEQKWKERISRINYNNLFIIFTDRDNCTEKDLENFDKLPYKNKIVFTHIPHKNINSAVYIKGFEKDSSVGLLSNYESESSITKFYNQFDLVNWFNKGM